MEATTPIELSSAEILNEGLEKVHSLLMWTSPLASGNGRGCTSSSTPSWGELPTTMILPLYLGVLRPPYLLALLTFAYLFEVFIGVRRNIPTLLCPTSVEQSNLVRVVCQLHSGLEP